MNTSALTRLRTWMQGQGFERFFVQQPENFAWLSGGDNTVVVLRPVGAWLEVTPDRLILHSSQIETGRLLDEEVPGVEFISYPWYEPLPPQGPSDLEHDLTALRLVLSAEEQKAFRDLGQDAAMALGEGIRSAQPEWSEYDLAGAISEELLHRGIQPVVLLVAGEERVFRYRHPIPKQRPLGKLCMGVICGRRSGLIASVTRLRSFGHPEAQRLNQQIAQVEAAALNASRPGATVGEVLQAIRQGYGAIGRVDEFENHHQGGITGYRSREVLARPGLEVKLEAGMALAWNPSIPGAKMEDTFLLTGGGLENLTTEEKWPTLRVEGRSRPMVLED